MAAVTLDKANPELVKLWHPTKNGDLKPETITSGSNKIIWWLCIKGHEWESSVYNMCKKKGNYCSFCSGQLPCKDNCLATLYPEIAKQWHPTKNGDLKPDKVLPHSSKKVWWLCEKGHEWPAAISDRTCINGTGCPYCSGKKPCYDNCLATLRPDLAKEWHPTKNDRTPSEVTLHSGYEAWWLCIKGHEWPAKVDTRSRGVGCPKCRAQISQLELRIYCELKYLFPSTISKKKIRGNECDVFIPEI